MESSVSNTLLILASTVFLIGYLQYRWKRSELNKLVPAFTWISITASILENLAIYMTRNLEHPDSWFKFMFDHSSPISYRLGPRQFFIVCEPEDFEIITKSQKSLSKDNLPYCYFKEMVGNGLATAPVAKWKRTRKLIAPSFTPKNLEGLFDIFRKNSKDLVQDMRKEDGNGFFDVYPYIGRYTITTICNTSIGTDLGTSRLTLSYLQWMIEKASQLFTQRMFGVWYYIAPLYYFSPLKKNISTHVSTVKAFAYTLVEDWKDRYSIGSKQESVEEGPISNSNHLLKFLLTTTMEGVCYSDAEIVDEVSTLIFAASETTATALSFTLVLLGIYPKIQEKLYREIIDVVGIDGTLKYENLKNLEYMERVIKESLRMYPAASTIARTIEQELQLKTRKLPAGSTVFLSIMALHRNPKFWPNPNKFDPDRFLPEEVSKRHPCSWAPFSAGPRNCVGVRYAWISMKVVLATFLREYLVTSSYKHPDEIPLQMAITIKAPGGCMIEIRRRTNHGYETTGTALSFTLVLLGIYPKIQEKVYREIIDVVGIDGTLKYDNLKNLEYMERVIKESLRMFPVASIIARTIEQELQLKTTKLPAGSTVFLSIMALHRNPKFWPNPNKFDPDRFLPEEVSKRHPCSWAPFSAGPRNCVGVRYAWISMKVLLATFLREYLVTSSYKHPDEISLQMAVTIKAAGGYMIEIRRRTNH